MFPKLHNPYQGIPIKVQAIFISFCFSVDSKIYMECKGPRRDKTILKKKKKLGGLTLPDFTYYRATLIKTVWY